MKGFVNLGKKGFATTKEIFVRKDVSEALKKAKKSLPDGFNFKVWTGYRSLEEQRRLVEKLEKKFKKEFPKKWHSMLVKYTGGMRC